MQKMISQSVVITCLHVTREQFYDVISINKNTILTDIEATSRNVREKHIYDGFCVSPTALVVIITASDLVPNYFWLFEKNSHATSFCLESHISMPSEIPSAEEIR